MNSPDPSLPTTRLRALFVITSIDSLRPRNITTAKRKCIRNLRSFPRFVNRIYPLSDTMKYVTTRWLVEKRLNEFNFPSAKSLPIRWWIISSRTECSPGHFRSSFVLLLEQLSLFLRKHLKWFFDLRRKNATAPCSKIYEMHRALMYHAFILTVFGIGF